MFTILEGCCLNKKTQTDGPFKYLRPPIILEVGKSDNWQKTRKEKYICKKRLFIMLNCVCLSGSEKEEILISELK